MVEFATERKLMCARGLLMLMHVEELSQFDWFQTSGEVMFAFIEIFADVHLEDIAMQGCDVFSEKHDIPVLLLASISNE